MFNVFTTFVSMPTFKKTFTDGAKGKKAFQLLGFILWAILTPVLNCIAIIK